MPTLEIKEALAFAKNQWFKFPDAADQRGPLWNLRKNLRANVLDAHAERPCALDQTFRIEIQAQTSVAERIEHQDHQRV